MLMKWTDLEVGDVLRVTDNFVVQSKITGWGRKYVNKDLTITKIYEDEKYLIIHFNNSFNKWNIHKDGTFWDIHSFGEIIPFEIVKLRDD